MKWIRPAWILSLIAYLGLAAIVLTEEVIDAWAGFPHAHRFLILAVGGLFIAPVAAGLVLQHRLYEILRQGFEERLTFFNQVSHQLRTPLTSIIAYSELLRDSPPADEQVRRQFLDVIHSEGEHLASLVEQLGLLARFDAQRAAGAARTVALPAILQSVLTELRPLAERAQVTLVANLGDDLPETMGDSDLLRHLFANLIENAIKYNRPQGLVRVTLRLEANWFVIGVSDTGIGIDAASLPQIFNPFFRQSRSEAYVRPGTGLGLSLVKRAVDWHGGQITVTSAVGEGTSFTVRLPYQPSQLAERRRDSAPLTQWVAGVSEVTRAALGDAREGRNGVTAVSVGSDYPPPREG